MMEAGFFALLLGGWAYLALARRRFDLPALAFLCATVYFLPGIMGYVSMPVTSIGLWVEQPLIAEAYGVYALVLAAILGAARICDRMGDFPPAPGAAPLDPILLARVTLAGAWVGFFWCLAVHGQDLRLPKEELLPHLSRGYVLWSEGATFGTLLAAVARRRGLLLGGLLLLAADMFVGFRIATAITLIALFFLWLSGEGPRRLLQDHGRKALLALPAAFLLLLYKQVMAVIKLGRWDLFLANLGNPEIYRMAIFQSEPFGTQSILHEVLRQHFRTDPRQLLEALVNALPFGNVFFPEPRTFNDLFQPALFPGLGYGLANNFWAQMWSVGGWPFLALACLGFAGLLVLGERCLRQPGQALKAFWAYFWVYFVFYLHRNDLAYQLYLQRRVALYALLFAVIAALLQRAGLRTAPSPEAP